MENIILQLKDYLNQLKQSPDSINFSETMEVINLYYNYTATAFQNGNIMNNTGENEGSCKIFAFAQLNELSDTETLSCFGHYYRDEVVKNPNQDNHQNIRQFIKTGWSGIKFDQIPLILKKPS